jgi:hypothetical protein
MEPGRAASVKEAADEGDMTGKDKREPSGVSKFFGDLANKTSLAAGRASLAPDRFRDFWLGGHFHPVIIVAGQELA